MKFPKIYHLPYSLGIGRSDKVLKNVNSFIRRRIVIAEKLDGENTSMHPDRIHARSEDSRHHDSRSWIKALHGSIKHLIPEELQIVGENVYARHSIFYDQLSTFFYVFAIIDKTRQVVLSVDSTIEYCERLGLEYVPILYRGAFPVQKFELPDKSAFGSIIEGYVVRLIDEFPLENFSHSITKWVRPDHVQTDIFWQKNWQPNKLRGT